MTRLEAIAASPVGYAKRGDLFATAHALFQRGEDGVLRPQLWAAGLAGATDWEPVLPDSAASRNASDGQTGNPNEPPAGRVVAPVIGLGREWAHADRRKRKNA